MFQSAKKSPLANTQDDEGLIYIKAGKLKGFNRLKSRL